MPEPIRRYIASACGLSRTPTIVDLRDYDDSNGRRTAVSALRGALGVRAFEQSDMPWLRSTAEDAAETKDNLPDIINVMLEELVHHRFEFPAFSALDRCAFAAREAVNARHFASVTALLSPLAKNLIDDLLKPGRGEAATTGWQELKRESKRPTNKEVRSYLQHIAKLRAYANEMPAVKIPAGKLRQYQRMARAMDASEMADLKPAKRYALAVIFIRAQCAQAFDDAGDLFVRLMRNLENLAQKRLAEYQLDRHKETDRLIGQLRDVLLAYKVDGSASQRINAIEDSLVAEVDKLIENCDEHLAYAGRNFLPFLVQPYKSVRAQLFNCLDIMAPKSTSADKETERLTAALQQLRTSRLDEVSAAQLGLNSQRDFKWLPAQWRKLVFVKPEGGYSGVLNRRYLELAVLHLIKDELTSGDLFIERGERYDDYREQLVDEETLSKELASYDALDDV